jgi:ubiquinone/menaquinone biosynthesis C-methylase UbiE
VQALGQETLNLGQALQAHWVRGYTLNHPGYLDWQQVDCMSACRRFLESFASFQADDHGVLVVQLRLVSNFQVFVEVGIMTQESVQRNFEPEKYQLVDSPCQDAMGERRAEHQAAFLLPYLRPGMKLLDCGCGPGSITAGLARLVTPGQVIGVDISPREIERAGILAAGQGVTNVQFELGSAYELPFEEGEFDAVYSNALLDHLRDPVAALSEMRRVVRPGGVVGVRTADRDGYLWAPSCPGMTKCTEWVERLKELQGVNVRLGKHLRALFRQAGLVRIHASASYDSYGTAESVQTFAKDFAATLVGNRRRAIIEAGLADQSEIEAAAVDILSWGESPDAFAAQSLCEAVGWRDD